MLSRARAGGASWPPDFSQRAQLSEWMDEPCTYEDFRACLRDLAQVNRVTFAYRPTRIWLQRLFARRSSQRPLHIVDVGSGGGDMLRQVAGWARRAGVAVQLTGIDLNPFAARAAAEQSLEGEEIDWITSDAFSYQAPQGIDVIISSLFTHHLPDEMIVRFLAWMEANARLGWLVNDLHRGALPYYAFGLAARVARWHRFVQHDGPVSIARSFSAEDWHAYLHRASLDRSAVTIEAFRPARLCVSRVR